MKRKNVFQFVLLFFIINPFFINFLIFQSKFNANESYSGVSKLNIKSANNEGPGEKINITLHQSIINTTEIEFNDLNISSSFIQACPTDPSFNSSLIKINIDAINAPNKILIVEDDYYAAPNRIDVFFNFISFEAKGKGFIENISMVVKKSVAGTCDMTLTLYNATENAGNIEPNISLGDIVSNEAITDTNYYWLNMTGINAAYDTSITYNNTFFLRVTDSGTPDLHLAYADDLLGTDAVDEHIVLDWLFAEIMPGGLSTCDTPLKIVFAPINNTPKPSYIGLKINGSAVSNNAGVNGSGYWQNTTEYYSPSGYLEFDMKANWEDVSCNVSQVLINYTKTDLKANSSFKEIDNGDEILWNVTINNNIYDFSGRFQNYIIIFRVPANWENIKVKNGTIDKTGDVFEGSTINNYKNIHVFNAGNGSNWFLTASVYSQEDKDGKPNGNGDLKKPLPFEMILLLMLSIISGIAIGFIIIKKKSKRELEKNQTHTLEK